MIVGDDEFDVVQASPAQVEEEVLGFREARGAAPGQFDGFSTPLSKLLSFPTQTHT